MSVMSIDETIQLQALDRVERLSDRTAEILREAIVNGTLPTGAYISIPRIAKLCGVSATPVREAIIHLAEAGLVSVHPQGVRVTEPTRAGLIAAFEVREAVEGMTARLAARRTTDAETRNLREIAERSIEVAAGEDITSFRKVDSEFHAGVAALSHSPQLEHYARNALDLSQTLRTIRPAQKPLRAASAHRHIEVAEAIANGDGDEAERIMRLHVREVLTQILEQLDADAD